MVTLRPPTSEAGVRFLAWPQVGQLVVACCRSDSITPQNNQTVCTRFPLPSPTTHRDMTLYSVESDVKPQINKISHWMQFL